MTTYTNLYLWLSGYRLLYL